MKNLAALALLLFNATASYLLWTGEFLSQADTLAYLERYFVCNCFFPFSALKIILFTTLSWTIVFPLILKKIHWQSIIKFFVAIYLITVALFYFNRFFIYENVFNTFFKFSLFYFLIALFILIPVYSYVCKLIINDCFIQTDKKLIRWIWWAIVITIPLSLLCLFVLDSGHLKNSWYIFTSIQKGYPVFWANLTIPIGTYLYLKKLERKNLNAANADIAQTAATDEN